MFSFARWTRPCTSASVELETILLVLFVDQWTSAPATKKSTAYREPDFSSLRKLASHIPTRMFSGSKFSRWNTSPNVCVPRRYFKIFISHFQSFCVGVFVTRASVYRINNIGSGDKRKP